MNDSQTCPICALPVPTPDSDAPLPEGFPFCSKRCRLIGTGGENGEGIPVYKTFHGGEVPGSPLLGMTRGVLQQPDRDLVFRAWCEDPPDNNRQPYTQSLKSSLIE